MKSDKEPGFQLKQERPGNYAGYIGDSKQIRYEFHGIGCLVIAPEFEVDFDFGEARRCDGIDNWFLFKFLNHNPVIREKYPLLTSDDDVERLLEELEKNGLVARDVDPLNERTYYLTADIHKLNPLTLRLYWADGNVC